MTKGNIERWQFFVLLTSLVQLTSPGLLTYLGYSVDSGSSSPQITPAGYTFIIWGIITFLSFFYGIYQILPSRNNKELHYQLSGKLSTVYILFSCWLLAAIFEWLITTVCIFLLMFLILTILFKKLLKEKHRLNTIEKILLFGQVAIYTGWTTVAVFANTASALKFYGFNDSGTIGILWQSTILILALLSSKYWLGKFKKDITYGTTILWALVGILFGLIQYNDTQFLMILVVFGVILVLSHLFYDRALKLLGITSIR